MPTIIIHPTQTPEACIKHDGPQARSWLPVRPAPADVAAPIFNQPGKRDTSFDSDPAPRAPVSAARDCDDAHRIFGGEWSRWQRHALTARAY